MLGRIWPAVGLAWGPGLSEVLGGSNAGVTAACPWGGGGTWGTGTPSTPGRAGSQATAARGGNGAGSEISWRVTVAAPPDEYPTRSGAEWPLGTPWAPAEAEDHGRSGSARCWRENAH